MEDDHEEAGTERLTHSPPEVFDSTRLFTVIDEPDTAVEIADWESSDARNAMMQSDARAAFAPPRSSTDGR
jgi:hypothetical protein